MKSWHGSCPWCSEAVKLGVPVSVDTYKPEVMQAVLDTGADIVNDVWALRMPGALEVVAGHPLCGVCLMHMHRDPQSMQVEPMEGDVLPSVSGFPASSVWWRLQRERALPSTGSPSIPVSVLGKRRSKTSACWPGRPSCWLGGACAGWLVAQVVSGLGHGQRHARRTRDRQRGGSVDRR